MVVIVVVAVAAVAVGAVVAAIIVNSKRSRNKVYVGSPSLLPSPAAPSGPTPYGSQNPDTKISLLAPGLANSLNPRPQHPEPLKSKTLQPECQASSLPKTYKN